MKVFLIAAVSADGYIARHTTEVADWTSSEDKKLFAKLTKEAGVMVMGATTLATIGRALPGRRTIVYTHHPQRIAIEDVEPTTETPADLVARLRSEGVTALAVCGGASIYTLFMQAGVIDELYLTVEPVLFGAGISLFSEPVEARLQLLESTALTSDSLLLHYAVRHE